MDYRTKYLKYKNKYLNLNNNMTGGGFNLINPFTGKKIEMPAEIFHNILSFLPDEDKIKWASYNPTADIGIQFLNNLITFKEAMSNIKDEFKIIDKFKITKIEVDNLYELNELITKQGPLYIRKLVFSDELFNEPLGTTLDRLTNLKELRFGFTFNRPLGKSLEKLTNLKELSFGFRFNEPLETSLDTLTNLKALKFGYGFNRPLGKSLERLTNLEILIFDSYNWPLITNENGTLISSLAGLTNLKGLDFGHMLQQPLIYDINRTLISSLAGLSNLQKIRFAPSFNQPLIINKYGTSVSLLANLTKLKTLILPRDFNQPLTYNVNGINISAFEGLLNLEKLVLGLYFNHSLSTSLAGLTNLQELIIDKRFNQPLDASLVGLTELRKIQLGNNLYETSYNKEFEYIDPVSKKRVSVFDGLINLQEIMCGNKPQLFFKLLSSINLSKLNHLIVIKFADDWKQWVIINDN